MKKSTPITLGAMLAAPLFLAACTTESPAASPSQGSGSDGLSIGITVADLANQYYVSVTDGMKDACETAGCTVEVHDGKQDTLSQIAAVENFITKKMDVIIVAANADNALDTAAKQAQSAGIPVIAHIGFTPQSVNGLGGFRVQGRGDAAEQTVHDAIAVQEAGAVAVVLEMVPAELATQITGKLTIPTMIRKPYRFFESREPAMVYLRDMVAREHPKDVPAAP